MMAQVNVYDAKAHLSALLARVETGEEIIIARSGRPVARLVPMEPPHASRKPGALRGRIKIAEDFDAGAEWPEWYDGPTEPPR